MESKFLQKAKEVYFVVVAVMMYYFLNEYIDVGLHVTYRHAFALVLFFSEYRQYSSHENKRLEVHVPYRAWTILCLYV